MPCACIVENCGRHHVNNGSSVRGAARSGRISVALELEKMTNTLCVNVVDNTCELRMLRIMRWRLKSCSRFNFVGLFKNS